MNLFYIFYNIILMFLIILLSPLLIVWLCTTPKARAGFWEKAGWFSGDFIKKLKHISAEHRIWCHAVSVGEFNAAKPLVKALVEKNFNVIISTTTATGNALARKTYPDLPVLYFPFDFPWIVSKVLRLIKPSIIVILETEIWPNLLFESSKENIPVFMANGRLSEKSFRGYKRIELFFRWVLNHYRLLLMQSDMDVERMRSLGVEPSKVIMTGNIKFDLPAAEANYLQEELKSIFGFNENSKILVFASTHPGEEIIFTAVFKNLVSDFPDLKAVIAPRHPERSREVSSILNQEGIKFVLRSRLASGVPGNIQEASVVLLDTIGELQDVFAISSIACMGGSFIGRGGHNPLEPVNAKIPVIFGPSMENFMDIALRIVQMQAGYQVENALETEQCIRELLVNHEKYRQVVYQGQQMLAQNRGATKKLIGYIDSVI